MLQLPSPNFAAQPQLLPSYKCGHAPTVFHNCRHSSSRKPAVRETKLYENVTYVLHAARGYRIKLQRHEYTERRTPDNIYICIYIYEKLQFNSLVWGSLTLVPISFLSVPSLQGKCEWEKVLVNNSTLPQIIVKKYQGEL